MSNLRRLVEAAADAFTGRIDGLGPLIVTMVPDTMAYDIVCLRCWGQVVRVTDTDVVAWRRSESAFVEGAKAVLLPAFTAHAASCPGVRRHRPTRPTQLTQPTAREASLMPTFKRRFGTEGP